MRNISRKYFNVEVPRPSILESKTTKKSDIFWATKDYIYFPVNLTYLIASIDKEAKIQLWVKTKLEDFFRISGEESNEDFKLKVELPENAAFLDSKKSYFAVFSITNSEKYPDLEIDQISKLTLDIDQWDKLVEKILETVK